MSPDNTTQREAVRRDPVRPRLKDLLRRNDLTLKAASLAIGRNRRYLQQYVDRGIPAVLGYRDSETLGEMLGCDPEELRHEAVPKRRPMKRRPPRIPAGLPGAPLVAVREVTVEVSAGAGTLAEEFVSETALWHWPENMIRHEAGAEPLPVTQDGAVLFFQLIKARHERASTVLTSNKGFGNGAVSSATRSWPPLSSTACCTTATSSTSAATATGCGSIGTCCGPGPSSPTRGSCCERQGLPTRHASGIGLRSLRHPTPLARPKPNRRASDPHRRPSRKCAVFDCQK